MRNRNLLLDRPLAFGDPEQIRLVKNHELKCQGILPVAIAEFFSKVVLDDSDDEDEWVYETTFKYDFHCLNNYCRKQLAGSISEDDAQDGVLILCTCGTSYHFEDTALKVVPSSLLQPKNISTCYLSENGGFLNEADAVYMIPGSLLEDTLSGRG